jgi:hypothetical protein
MNKQKHKQANTRTNKQANKQIQVFTFPSDFVACPAYSKQEQQKPQRALGGTKSNIRKRIKGVIVSGATSRAYLQPRKLLLQWLKPGKP